MDGVRVKGYWPASFLSVGGGINITLQSYADRICFGVMGAPEQVGDLRPFIGHLEAALAEVVAAVEASASEQPAPRTRRATASRPD